MTSYSNARLALFWGKIKVLPSNVRKLEVSLLQVTMAMNFI
jgi:hypothetical protein